MRISGPGVCALLLLVHAPYHPLSHAHPATLSHAMRTRHALHAVLYFYWAAPVVHGQSAVDDWDWDWFAFSGLN